MLHQGPSTLRSLYPDDLVAREAGYNRSPGVWPLPAVQCAGVNVAADGLSGCIGRQGRHEDDGERDQDVMVFHFGPPLSGRSAGKPPGVESSRPDESSRLVEPVA